MLKSRVISALIGVPIILIFLLLGKLPFLFLVAVLVFFGLDEFYSMVKLKGSKPNVYLGMLGGILLLVGALFKNWLGIGIILAAFVIAALVWYVATDARFNFDVSPTLAGVLYVGFLLAHLILISNLGKGREGLYLVLLVFVATWVYDIVAYAAGKKLGERKLAPRVSPHKTWEGAIVAALSSILVLGALFFIKGLVLYQRVLLGLVVGIAAPIGDLVESSLKREVGVKDTGVIIPGHGGILDRFDSLLFTATASYYLLRLFLR